MSATCNQCLAGWHWRCQRRSDCACGICTASRQAIRDDIRATRRPPWARPQGAPGGKRGPKPMTKAEGDVIARDVLAVVQAIYETPARDRCVTAQP